MKYNKLVRDKIPEILRKRKLKVKKHIAENEEYWEKLKEKLQEEVNEFLKEDNENELVDILEIIKAICEFKKIDKSKLKTLLKKKSEERGKFKDRIILDEVKE